MTYGRRLALGGCLLLTWWFAVQDARAQSTSAGLTGTVSTETGDPVSGAVVQARSRDTGIVRTAVSDPRGRYRFGPLTPGEWTVVARLVDGGLSEARVVGLRLQQTVKLDFTVAAGPTEHVRVKAEAPLVDRKETAGKLRVGSGQVNDLPLAGRVFTDLALLDSSVRQAAPGNFSGERGTVFVINGQSGRSNSFLVDGLDNNDQTSGTTLNAFFSQQVIQEFVLSTNQYSPEFGRASGGVLNIVTKRGSNEPKWDAFVQGTAAQWNEPGSFVGDLPDTDGSGDTLSRFQGGFTFSGPVREDRAFYFFAYEHQESDDIVPYTGIDRDDVKGGRLKAPSEDDNIFLRTDFNLGPANTLMVRLSADDRSNEGVNVGGVMTPESGFRIEEQDVQLAATWTSVLGPNLVGETRFLAGTSEFNQFANSDRPGVSHPGGVYGGNTLNRQIREEDRFQLVQNLTWQRGQHRLKLGFDVTYSSTKIQARFNPNGGFIYDYDKRFGETIDLGDCPDVTPTMVKNAQDAANAAGEDFDGEIACAGDHNGNDVFDESANIFTFPKVYSLIDGQPDSVLRDTSIALFAQDQWEISRRWLLDYGLRYDVSNYKLPSSARVDSVIPNGASERDTDNIAPRFGFTFTPRAEGKTLIRGGAGIFYDKLVLAFPAVAAITSGTEILLSFNQGFAFEWFNEDDGNPLYQEDTIEEQGVEEIRTELRSLSEVFEQLVMRFSTGTEMETPHTVQFNLGMERQIGEHAAFGVDLVRAQGYDLPIMKDLNPVSGLTNFPAPCDESSIDPDLDVGVPCHLRDPGKGSIAAIVTEGRSWYTGLDLNFRWQTDDAWFRASYTWSESEDLGFDPLKGGIALPPDSDNLSGERGRSDGDREHRLVISGQTALPLMGLRGSVVLQLSSGLPFDVTTGQDDNLDGILSDRPEGVGRNEGEDTSIAAINELRAAQPSVLLELDPVTSLDEPSFFQVDLRLARPFLFHRGRGNGEMFLQVVNLLDRENGGLIESRAISPDFGRTIGLAGPPRTLELGLRVGY